MNTESPFRPRLAVAAAFGISILLIALVSAYDRACQSELGTGQAKTKQHIKQFVQDIQRYQVAKGKLPDSLDEVNAIYPWPSKVYPGDWDGWDKRFIYTVNGKNYQIVSYGADAKPGGTGVDADITIANANAPNVPFTFADYLNSRYTVNMVNTALVIGFLASIVCFVTVRPKRFDRVAVIKGTIAFLVTAAVSGAMATALTLFHMPHFYVSDH